MPTRNAPVISRGKPIAPPNPEGVRKVEQALALKRKKGLFSRNPKMGREKIGEKKKGIFAQLLGAFKGRKF